MKMNRRVVRPTRQANDHLMPCTVMRKFQRPLQARDDLLNDGKTKAETGQVATGIASGKCVEQLTLLALRQASSRVDDDDANEGIFITQYNIHGSAAVLEGIIDQIDQ